jgi:hypothetical protein
LSWADVIRSIGPSDFRVVRSFATAKYQVFRPFVSGAIACVLASIFSSRKKLTYDGIFCWDCPALSLARSGLVKKSSYE